MALFCVYHTLRLHLGHPGARHVLIFTASLLAYGIELCIAIAYIVHPHDTDLLTYLTFVLIACFSVALSRAWQLMQNTTIGTDETPTAGTPR